MLHTIFWIRLLGVAGINLMLSGDNAVVVALAARRLPPRERRLAIMWGTGAIVVLLLIFVVAITWLLKIPLLRVAAGIALAVIAFKLATESHGDDDDQVQAATTLGQAIRTIVIADIVMSLDNVVGLVGVADGQWGPLIGGLVITMPIVIFGAQMLARVLERWHWLVYLGAGLLVYVAVGMVFADKLAHGWLKSVAPHEHLIAAIAGVLFIAIAWAWTHFRRSGGSAPQPSRRTASRPAQTDRLKSEMEARSI